MKNTILMIALIASTGIANADWENVWESSDLNTEAPYSAAEVMPSVMSPAVALESFGAGNPDIDNDYTVEQGTTTHSDTSLTALEAFNIDNPDQV